MLEFKKRLIDVYKPIILLAILMVVIVSTLWFLTLMLYIIVGPA